MLLNVHCWLWFMWLRILHRSERWRRWGPRCCDDLMGWSRVRRRHRMWRCFNQVLLRLLIRYACYDLLRWWWYGVKHLQSWRRLHLRVERTSCNNMLLLWWWPIFCRADDRWLADDLNLIRITHRLCGKLYVLHGTNRNLLDLR